MNYKKSYVAKPGFTPICRIGECSLKKLEFGMIELYGGDEVTYETKDGEIDECYAVKQDELVEFPKGYHTTVGTPGYNTYFLWMMAGEHQGFYRANDPEHDWVTAVENLIKKNR